MTRSLRDAPVVLVEPDVNPVAERFGLSIVASYPPLAQVRLAGQIDDDHARIVDLRVPGEKRRFLRSIERDPPAIAGISLTFTSNGDEALTTAAAIREASPSTTIVLGGSGASEDPAAFAGGEVDLLCRGRGDASFPALVGELRASGRVPTRFPGFLHRSAGGWASAGEAPPPTPGLDELRPFAWHLLPRRYWKHYYQGYRPTGMGQTSEGCPFDCTFCSVWKVHGRKVNVASLANVQHDLRSLPGFVRAFFFADDIWMQASESQLQALHDPLLRWVADELRLKRAELWLTAETRTDLFLRQEARFRAWHRDGGLKRVFFGVEAVTDDQLDDFSKRTTVEVNSRAMRTAAEMGLFVTAQFVVPCEADRAYFDELVRFIEAHRQWIRMASCTIATPLPGTELYQDVVERHPELADRRVVAHPAFSLYTALSPTRLDAAEFYEQIARVHRAANQFELDWTALENLAVVCLKSPWLLRPLLKLPRRVRRLTEASTFLETHREVQGDRLLGATAP